MLQKFKDRPPGMTEIPTFVKNSVIMKLFVLSITWGISLALALQPTACAQPLGLYSPTGLPAYLPTPEMLHAALDTFLDRQLLATLAEFDGSQRGEWMNYVPSVGIGYNLAADREGRVTSWPRPAVSFSLAQVFAARQQRRDRLAKRQSIIATAELQRSQLHSQLSAMLQRYELMQLELATMRRVHDIERQLYELAVIDYEAAKLAPSGFLPKEKAYLEHQLTLRRKEMEIVEWENQVLILLILGYEV